MKKKENQTDVSKDKSVDDLSLRPDNFSDFVGQKEIIANLKIFIESAKKRNSVLDHILLSGPPGLGKTTLATIIAKEMNSEVTITSAQVISKGADLARFLTLLNESDILFIDEIHSLGRNLEEILYPAMEDYKIDLVVGEGITAQSVEIPLKKFTLVGATTRSGMISEPLKNRFGIQFRLEYYSDEEMSLIVSRSAKLLGVKISDEACLLIGSRSRKTPRIANHLIKRIRDYAEVENEGVIDKKISEKAFSKLGIDSLGLDNMDRQILSVMIERYKGGPVGLKAIAVVVGEEERTIEDSYESYLVRIGLIKRTPSGRMATELAYQHLGYDFKREPQERTLFI